MRPALILAAVLLCSSLDTLAQVPPPPEKWFKHHLLDDTLPVYDGAGDYGQTAAADLDRDGRPDLILGRRPSRGKPSLIYWYRLNSKDNVTPANWTRHTLGRDSPSDVGAAPLDVDGDGWIDLVTGGAWYQNSHNPTEREFTRHVFDPALNQQIHDVLIADLDGDKKPDLVTLHGGPPNTPAKDGLRWYKIPEDATQPWEKHIIGPGVHGAIVPSAALDIDSDGDLDLVVADTWYENADAKAGSWKPHKVLPFGRKGPFGVCVRTAFADFDGTGKPIIVMADADITDSKIALLRNPDGKGLKWDRQDLPQSFKYGSLHSLAVADFNSDGRPDIVSNEQEELLPDNRTDPRWVMWLNLGPDASGKARFSEHIILNAKLGGHELVVADFDSDGKPDIASKPWGPRPWNAAGGKIHVDLLHNQRP